jgi:hypothetical protein
LPSFEGLAGSSIGFGVGQAGVPYLDQGWSFPEGDGVWSVGPSSTIVISMTGAPLPPVELILDTDSFLIPAHSAYDVSVEAQGRSVGRMHFDLHGLRGGFVRIPLGLVEMDPKKALILTFRTQDPLAPAAAGIGPDPRELGFKLKSVIFMQSSRDQHSSVAGDPDQPAP